MHIYTCTCIHMHMYTCTCIHMHIYTHAQPIPRGVKSSKALSKLKARTSLLTETWQKRRSSFELWYSIQKCHPTWDWLYIYLCVHMYIYLCVHMYIYLCVHIPRVNLCVYVSTYIYVLCVYSHRPEGCQQYTDTSICIRCRGMAWLRLVGSIKL